MNSCYGQVVNGVQQMGLCDYFSMVMWILGFLGICFIVWGAIRQTVSKGAEVASEIAGNQTGEQIFRKARRTSWWIFGIGIAMLAVAIIIGFSLP